MAIAGEVLSDQSAGVPGTLNLAGQEVTPEIEGETANPGFATGGWFIGRVSEASSDLVVSLSDTKTLMVGKPVTLTRSLHSIQHEAESFEPLHITFAIATVLDSHRIEMWIFQSL